MQPPRPRSSATLHAKPLVHGVQERNPVAVLCFGEGVSVLKYGGASINRLRPQTFNDSKLVVNARGGALAIDLTVNIKYGRLSPPSALDPQAIAEAASSILSTPRVTTSTSKVRAPPRPGPPRCLSAAWPPSASRPMSSCAPQPMNAWPPHVRPATS